MHPTFFRPSLEQFAGYATGAYSVNHDERALLHIAHPWEASKAGAYGAFCSNVVLQDAWRAEEPLFLHFYHSDTYSGQWLPDDWMGTQAFIGHRFKQVLIGEQVVWECDVADEQLAGRIEDYYCAGPGRPGYINPYVSVDISRAADRFLGSGRLPRFPVGTASLATTGSWRRQMRWWKRRIRTRNLVAGFLTTYTDAGTTAARSHS